MTTSDDVLANTLPWEAASTPDVPWPRGWFGAPVRAMRCTIGGHRIDAGKPMFCTGLPGECYCATHSAWAEKTTEPEPES